MVRRDFRMSGMSRTLSTTPVAQIINPLKGLGQRSIVLVSLLPDWLS